MQLLDRITARLALVGADPHDNEDLRAHKALLVLISVPATILLGRHATLAAPAGRIAA